MPDQQQLLGFRPDLLAGATVVSEPLDSASIAVELGEIATAVMRREKVGSISLSDDARAALVAHVERAQAARWVGAVRAAGEQPSVAPAPTVTPDTVWSGNFNTLVTLVDLGIRRERFRHEQRRLHSYGLTLEQP